MKRIAAIIIGIFLLAKALYCNADDLELKIFKIKHGNAQSLYNVANDLKSEKGKLSFDANTNSLILRDYPQNIQHISQVIESLDVEGKQVEIKVSIVEASTEFFNNIGITYGEIIIPSAKFAGILQAINSAKDSNVRTSMMLRTQSNQPAALNVSTDEIIGSQVIITGDTAQISPLREPVGSFLEVLPIVNDGTITVTLRPSVSVKGKHGAVEEQTVLTEVTISDGDTIAIAGLNSQKEVSQTSGPFSKIPLSSETRGENKKVVMFLTAKIVN
jgi:type IV pilus assembly protein PilQ